MSWILIATLLLVGVLFLLLEVLVVPGATVTGIIGFACIAGGIYFTYDNYGSTAGHIVAASSLVLSIVMLVFALRSRTWKRAMLTREIDGKANVIDAEKLHPGDSGVAVSRLAPSGRGEFGGEYYEVHSQGEWINPGQEITVVSIEGYKVIVKSKN